MLVQSVVEKFWKCGDGCELGDWKWGDGCGWGDWVRSVVISLSKWGKWLKLYVGGFCWGWVVVVVVSWLSWCGVVCLDDVGCDDVGLGDCCDCCCDEEGDGCSFCDACCFNPWLDPCSFPIPLPLWPESCELCEPDGTRGCIIVVVSGLVDWVGVRDCVGRFLGEVCWPKWSPLSFLGEVCWPKLSLRSFLGECGPNVDFLPLSSPLLWYEPWWWWCLGDENPIASDRVDMWETEWASDVLISPSDSLIKWFLVWPWWPKLL